MMTDPELLRRFAQTNAEDAFAELVRRHLNLVYSTALRRTNGDGQLAQDVAQTVFADLAHKAAELTRRESLSGWLYTSSHFAAAKAVRTENRRRARETTFMREPINEAEQEAAWHTIRPVLDDVMHELKAADREAIVLRYFENRPFTDVGARIGLKENAARMRVERALEKLRALLLKRGISTTSGLASAISANAVQLAPVHLAKVLASASITASKSGLTFSIIKIMTTTKLQISLGTLAAIGAATIMVVQHQSQAKLLAENEQLQQEIAQLKAENESLSNRVAPGEPKPASDAQLSELLRLRGEIGVLRRQTNELANAQKSQPMPKTSAMQRMSTPLPENYPTTPDAATKGIFESWARGDWEAFFTNFAEPGVPREFYDQVFNDGIKNSLAGMEIMNVGQPTNSFSTNMWFVPYRLRFKDGTEKEMRLHVAQDPRTQKWYFKGGF
jgi:RNA polymerase sigma factor (sigma-70 family)